MTQADQPQDDVMIPLAEERLVVSKKEVETGRIHVSTRTQEQVVHVDDTVRTTSVDVQRIAIGQYVEVEPQAREEDGVLIVPVVEEVYVKRLLLKEELRITRTSTLAHVERVMHADVERH